MDIPLFLLEGSFDPWLVVVCTDLTDAGGGVRATKLRRRGDAEAREAPGAVELEASAQPRRRRRRR